MKTSEVLALEGSTTARERERERGIENESEQASEPFLMAGTYPGAVLASLGPVLLHPPYTSHGLDLEAGNLFRISHIGGGDSVT